MSGNRRMWDIGNTTVRNPERLYPALEVFDEAIAGRIYNRDTQAAYWAALRDAGVLTSSADQGDWHGRKFLSALIQLGFVHRDSNARLTTTAVGRTFLDHPDLQDRTMLRQLLKYRIGSPIEPQNHLHLRPFVLILRVLRRARERGMRGLSHDEIAAFVIPTLTDDDTAVEAIVERVASYRAALAARSGNVAKRQYTAEVLSEAVPDNRRPATLRDYADSSMRYARFTNAVTLSASGGRFVLSDKRLDEVLNILDCLSMPVLDAEYTENFHDPEAPELPLDNVELATERIEELRESLSGASHVDVPATALTSPFPESKAALQQELFNLERLSQEEAEIEFYRRQRSREALEEIRDVLVEVQSSSSSYGTYRPAMLEWALWRLFLAINNIEGPVSDTRGFPVDADFNPLHHAAANRPDAAVPYRDSAVVIEGTLTRSGRQVATEGEPVRRHVAQYVADNRSKRVRSLFVAPAIDPNTYNEFYRASYEIDDVDYDTDIVPLTIDDIILLIDKMIEYCRVIDDEGLLQILDGVLHLRAEHETARSWRACIPERYEQLVDQVVARAAPLPVTEQVHSFP